MTKKRDDLAGIIADEINKTFKHQQTAFFLGGDQETPTDIRGFVSTGSTMLDLAIANKPNGGLGVGRITELNGLEGSGKSLIGAHALADCQRQGGVAVYIDTESAVSEEFLRAIGVDTKNMLYVHLETVEEIFETIDTIVTKVRESDKDKLVTILVDSLAAASTKVEMDAEFDKDGWATSKAIILSKAMRKITQMIARQKVCLIFTNQLRVKLGVMFGDPWTTSGGKALPFHASTRIRLKNMGQLKDKKNNVLGMKVRAQIVKNRLGPPLRHTDYTMYFDRGIDNYGNWLEKMKEHGICKIGGAWYTLHYNGEDIKFLSKDFESVLEKDPAMKDWLYHQICDKVILKYQDNIGIDDVKVDDTNAEE